MTRVDGSMQSAAYLSVMTSATPHIRVAVLGASGFAGGELIRLLDAHPFAEVTFLGCARVGREDARRDPPEPGLARAGDGDASGADRGGRCRRGRRRVLLAAPRGERRAGSGSARSKHQGDRSGRRFPAPRIGLSGLVRVRAPRGRLAGQGRLRPPGAVRRATSRRAARREPGVLPDAGDPRPVAAAVRRPGGARPDPRRRQDRALRRRSDGERRRPVRGIRGERSPVPRAAASAHARDGARPRARDAVSRRRSCSYRTWSRRSAASSRRRTHRSRPERRPRR